MTTHRLAIVPRDGLFLKDGRGWYTSATGRAHALEWPWPSTVLGALRAAWGRVAEDQVGTRFQREEWPQRTEGIRLGRTLPLRRGRGEAWNPVWPAPADALWLRGEGDHEEAVHRLQPMSRQVRTLGRDDDPAREALWWPAPPGDGKPAPAPRWWRHEDLVGWLAGERATVNRADCPSLWRRLQAHVSIRAESQTAEDGLLFQHDVVETIERDHEWAICVEAEFPDGAIPTIASIGGGRRLARVEPLESNVFEPPERVLSAFRAGSRGLRLVGVTPALFGAGWLPDGLGASNGAYRGRLPVLAYDLVLRSALVQRPANVVGWDMASNTSRATARMVPAGSVYFFERADGGPFDDADAGVLWLTALGGRTEEGFGRFVPGVWNPERSAA